MESHFTDDRDLLPEEPNCTDGRRQRGATFGGSLIIAGVLLSVVFASTIGGTIDELNRPATFGSAQFGHDFWLCRGIELIVGAWLFSVGSSIASFLNVVAWRAPKGMSINGHSFCPNCKTPIAAVDNLPIVGWLRLRGRCFTCDQPISPKYPIFEAIGGYLFLLFYAVEFLSQGRNLPQDFIPQAAYGLTSNFQHISNELIWVFGVHLLLIAYLLSLLMTRLEGGRLPVSYSAVVLVAIVLASLIEPSVVNTAYESLNMTPPDDRSSLVRFYAVVTPVALLLWVAIIAIVSLRTATHQETDQDDRNSTSVFLLASHWVLASLMCVIVLGPAPALVVFLASLLSFCVYSQLYVKDNKGVAKLACLNCVDYWLPIVYVYLISWKGLAYSIGAM